MREINLLNKPLPFPFGENYPYTNPYFKVCNTVYQKFICTDSVGKEHISLIRIDQDIRHLCTNSYSNSVVESTYDYCIHSLSVFK